MVAMKKQTPKNSPAKVKNGGVDKTENTGKLSKNQLKKLKKQQLAGATQEISNKNGGAVKAPKQNQNQQGKKGGANKQAQIKAKKDSSDDDDEEEDEDDDDSDAEEDEAPGKMDVEADDDDDGESDEDDDDDDDEEEDDDDEEEEDDDDSEEEEEETPEVKPKKEQTKKEKKAPKQETATKKQETPVKAEKGTIAKIFFASVNVELSAKDVVDALGKILNQDDPSIRVDVQNVFYGIPSTKIETRIVLDVSKPENKQKFSEGFSFKVKNTEVTYERTKDFGEPRDFGERKFNLEMRISNLPKNLPENLGDCKGQIEEAALEALDSKYKKSDIHSVFVSKDREAGAIAVTSEGFYKDLLALGEFDVGGTSVTVEPRPYKVYASCGSSNYDTESLESGLKKLVGASNVIDFTYNDGKDPLVHVKDFYTAKKLILEITEHSINGQTYKFSSPFIYIKANNFGGGFGGGRGGGFRGGRGFGGGRGGGERRSFGGGERRSFGGRGGGGKRFAPY